MLNIAAWPWRDLVCEHKEKATRGVMLSEAFNCFMDALECKGGAPLMTQGDKPAPGIAWNVENGVGLNVLCNIFDLW